MKWKNLEKRIFRQRLVIEGKYAKPLSAAELRSFLKKLSEHVGMTIIFGPIVKNLAGAINPIHSGYEAIVVWAESGVQLYTWEKFGFLTLDMYTCKKFNVKSTLAFVRKHLKITELVWKEV